MYQIYKITHKDTGKYYIGKHGGCVFEDNYWGSGNLIKRAIYKHGRDNFEKEVIKEFKNEKEAFSFESEVVTDKEVEDEDCYNLRVGGLGSPSGERHPMYGKEGGFKGKSHTDDTKKVMSKRKINNKIRSIKVIHIESGEIFLSMTLAAKKFNMTKGNVSRHCNNIFKTQKFKFYEEL